jgi:hypothetical protein
MGGEEKKVPKKKPTWAEESKKKLEVVPDTSFGTWHQDLLCTFK